MTDLKERYGVWCQVSGGVTGPHEAWLKRAGNVITFATREDAEAEAKLIAGKLSRYSTAQFRYSARQLGSGVVVALVALIIMTGAALAQERTLYDSSGRVVGRASTDSQGTTTFRDAGGRTTGRESPNGSGGTTIYDPGGRAIGRTTGGKDGNRQR